MLVGDEVVAVFDVELIGCQVAGTWSTDDPAGRVESLRVIDRAGHVVAVGDSIRVSSLCPGGAVHWYGFHHG